MKEALYFDTVLWKKIREWNDRAWDTQQREIQELLETMALPDAITYLACYHHENGFVEFNESQVRYFACGNERGTQQFLIRYDPNRARRAPVGRAGLCVFDVSDLRHQQKGLQHHYTFSVNDRGYRGFTTPFPFGLYHTSVASVNHEPQGWNDFAPELDQHARVQQIVEDQVELADGLRGWVVMYNGKDAGNSVDHHHYHVLQLPAGHGRFPIQQAAEHAGRDSTKQVIRFGDDLHFPMTAFRISGPKSSVIREAVNIIVDWVRLEPSAASGNLIALTEQDQICVYFVPRNRLLALAPGFPYRPGVTEVSGEFIYSAEEDLRQILAGSINFTRLWSALKSIHPPSASALSG